MELTYSHVVMNHTEVSAVTLSTAPLLFPIPRNLYASKAVKCDRNKSKVFYLWSKEFHTFVQKTGGYSEALIFKYISSFCIRYYGE
jgi:hypothetical protein